MILLCCTRAASISPRHVDVLEPAERGAERHEQVEGRAEAEVEGVGGAALRQRGEPRVGLILVNSLSNPHCSSRHVPRGSPSRGGARRPFTEGGALSFELRMFPEGTSYRRARYGTSNRESGAPGRVNALQTGAGWHLGVIAEEMSSTVLVRFAGSVASKWYLRSLQGSRWELQDSARRHVVEKKREGGVLVHELWCLARLVPRWHDRTGQESTRVSTIL